MNEKQEQEGGGPDSAGALIRQARELAGLHLGAVAASLKVPVQRIEALEADRHDLLPGPVFTRALASSVCRLLKLDSAAVLALLPKPSEHNLVVPGTLNQALGSVGHGGSGRARVRLSRPAAIAGAALLVAAVLVYALPGLDVFLQDRPAILALPAPKAPGLVTETVAPIHRSATSTMAVAPSAATGPLLAAPLPATPSAPSAQAAAPSALVVDASPLSFSVQKPTWVEVVDAAGVVVLRRTLNPGEELSATGKMPLQVTVGDVDGLQAKVRGQAKDLRPLAQNKVARFEVN